MKKFIGGFVAGALFFGVVGAFAAVSYNAEPASFKVMVDGKEFVSEPSAVVIDGYTYLPLRAMGNALGVPVEWNSELKQAEVLSSAYTESVSLYNFVVGDVWNDGFWFMARYADGSYGEYADEYRDVYAEKEDEEFDISKVIAHIKKTKITMDYYNLQLEGNAEWEKLYEEYQKLYEIADSGKYSDGAVSTDAFENARDAFCDALLK